MKKYLESFLSAILLATSILLGLSFWLNIKFSFNLFSANHWNELAKLQVSHTPINNTFYISISVALFLFIIGLYIIFRPKFRKIFKQQQNKNQFVPAKPVIPVTSEPPHNDIPDTKPTVVQPAVTISQPPKLHLPKNMATIVAERNQHNESLNVQTQTHVIKPDSTNRVTTYDARMAEIFTNCAYLVKPNPTISGFTPNLFAIGNNELVWIGATDCDINVFQRAIDKLKKVFKDSLPDIPITVYAFILDTKRIYNSTDGIFIFHTIEELQDFIFQSQGTDIAESDQENFDAYSEYIDTIIQYIKNI